MYAFYIFGNWNCTDCSFHSQAQDEIKLLCYANIRNICIAISSRNLSVIAFCVCAWRTYSELRKGGLEQIGYYLQWQHIGSIRNRVFKCLFIQQSHQEKVHTQFLNYRMCRHRKFSSCCLCFFSCGSVGIRTSA